MKMSFKVILVAGLIVLIPVVVAAVFLPAVVWRPARTVVAHPYTDTEVAGRKVFYSNGCNYCHTQHVREESFPASSQTLAYGSTSCRMNRGRRRIMGENRRMLFLDIGGVLLTNGWDHNARRRAAEHFGFDYGEMDDRHRMTFDTYEEGKLSLQEYLHRVVFYERRGFTPEEFRQFMYAQSAPYPEMIELVRHLKSRHRLGVGAISNEGRELTVYRIARFELSSFVDFFVSSCFVHYRKPDEDIYRVALDVSQADPERSVYIDDRRMFAEIAGGLGIHGIHHRDLDTTREALADLGLDDGRTEGGRQ
jgi:putative hydrolase of the HAD superfamily